MIQPAAEGSSPIIPVYGSPIIPFVQSLQDGWRATSVLFPAFI